jgi:two-component system, sensor histidine kinase RegB
LYRAVQGSAPWDQIAGRGRLRLGTLIGLRWRGAIVQAALFGFLWWRGFDAPYVLLAGLVAASTVSNILLMVFDHAKRQAADSETAIVLTFDVLQMSAMLYFTGGVLNPFAMLLIAPVALGAATVRTRYSVGIGMLALGAVAVLSRWSWPLPALPGEVLMVPEFYRRAMGVALFAGIAFTGSYAWRASVEAAQMELALNVTQTVLAREQRLSALGALAAAAAHELGTPLATIQIVAKEIARSAPPGPLRDDSELLVSQAERCREILRRLTEEPETDDAMHARMGLLQFVNEVIEPHLGAGVRVEAVVSGPPGDSPPQIRRLPELVHAMTSLVENAVDFATSEVLVRARFDDEFITIEVRDDGPGFAHDVLVRLGQPYVTSRPGGEGSRSGHVGMGLGFFIAKTLLERSGAVVSFSNAKGGGAAVAARWHRGDIEAPTGPEFSNWGA